MIEFLETIGSMTLEVFWLPLLAWSVFWMMMEAAFHLKHDLHPATRYRAYQAVLMSLPVGIGLAAIASAAAVVPEAPVVITFERPVAISAISPAAGAEALMEPGSQLSLSLVLGSLVIVAAAAAIVQFARLAANALALRRFRHSLAASTGGDSSDQAVSMDARRPTVQVVETSDTLVPMTFGLIRPVIVIPSWLSADDKRLALEHELVHVRRRDYLAQWVESVVAAIFAVHPAIHLLRRRCDLMREVSCDAALLADPAVSARSYANLLFHFVQPHTTRHDVSVSMAVPEPHLHQRLHAMKSYAALRHLNPGRSAWTFALCVMMIGAGMLVIPQVFAQQVQPPPPPPAAQEPDRPDAPYIILDGEPFRGSPHEIDPARISHIEVIRGQKAIDAHGERGRNGVVLITTGERPPSPPPPPPPPSPAADTSTFMVVESMPELIGGLESIQQNLRYPEEAKQAGIQGRVFVQFVVDEDGYVVEPEVTRGLGGGLDEEALRVVAAARFKAGTQRGEPVRVKMALPITFRLGEEVQPSNDAPVQRDVINILTLEVRPDGDAGDVTIRGTVVNTDTGEPLVGASISGTLGDQTVGAASDDEGRFVLHAANVPRPTARPYALEVSHPSLDGPYTAVVNGADQNVATELPSRFAVRGVHPNPFDGATTLTFDLPERANVRVEVYDVAGRRVLTVPERTFSAGTGQSILIDASSLAAGAYIYRIHAEIDGTSHTSSGNLTLVR